MARSALPVPGVSPVGNRQREYVIESTGEIISRRQYQKLQHNPQIAPASIGAFRGRGIKSGIATLESVARVSKERGQPSTRSLYDKVVDALFYRNRDKYQNKRQVQQSPELQKAYEVTRDVSKGKISGKRKYEAIREWVEDYPDVDYSDLYWGD